MKRFFASLHYRALNGFRLTKREATTLEGVMKRINNAIKEGRGIRLTKEELQVLGLYGLKQEVEAEEAG